MNQQPFQLAHLNYILHFHRMGRKKKDAEAAFFADFENDDFSTEPHGAAPGSQDEPVVPGMFFHMLLIWNALDHLIVSWVGMGPLRSCVTS
jgi:hypothetical protein